jgi:hypothetical protein
MVAPKSYKEAFARFFEEPTRERLRELLRENLGETKLLDFKEAWPKHPALAKHVLALANTGNGCVVAGVKENDDKTLEPVGLSQLTDKVDIINGIKSFLPSDLLTRLEVLDFAFEASEYPKLIGKAFQVLLVEFSPEHTPAVSLREGDGIRNAAVYVRREGQTAEATHDELQAIINKRIETKYSTSDEISLKQHMEQLRVLYTEIPRTISFAQSFFGSLTGAGSVFRVNANAPEESYEDFVKRMIELKKRIISRTIGASSEMIEANRIAEGYKSLAKASPTRAS